MKKEKDGGILKVKGNWAKSKDQNKREEQPRERSKQNRTDKNRKKPKQTRTEKNLLKRANLTNERLAIIYAITSTYVVLMSGTHQSNIAKIVSWVQGLHWVISDLQKDEFLMISVHQLKVYTYTRLGVFFCFNMDSIRHVSSKEQKLDW